MAGGKANLRGFIEAAGRSLTGAQGELVGSGASATRLAISEAELEVKATLERDEAGGVDLQLVTSGDARRSEIDPGMLSTVRIRYVTAPEDMLAPLAEKPTRTEAKAIASVKRREDIRSLDRILGGLTFEASFVPATKRWLVIARDPKDRLVREIVVADTKGQLGVAKPSASDVHRLKALDRKLTKEVREAEKKLAAALRENASLAERVEESSADRENLRTAALELRTELEETRSELEHATKMAATAEAESRSLRAERDALTESLAIANEQLAGKSIAPAMSAKEVSKLVDGFVHDLSSRLSGMEVSDGELQLKVGFEKVGRKIGFVVPGPESPSELRENLHEVSIRFARSGDPPER